MTSLGIVRRLIPQWGTTYGPAGDGPFPGVIVLHGSEGALSGWSHRNAVILAAHGFIAFPFGYSQGSNPWGTVRIVDVPLDRTVDALEAFRNFAFCGNRVALYGVSRGAEHALLVASLMAQAGLPHLPDAVAAHSPPDVVCGGFDSARWRSAKDDDWKAWDPAERAWTWKGGTEKLCPGDPIGVEAYDRPIFLSHGTKDTVWTVDMTRRLEARLLRADRRVEAHYYEGEDHIPGSDGENRHHEKLLDFLARSLA